MIKKFCARTQGVVVRGFGDRRLVVGFAHSLEPMTVSLPLREIRQIAVLGADPTETEKRFTVAAQIDSDKWVRLGVFDNATDADTLIRACAEAMAGSRWKQVWITIGLSGVMGFCFLVMANLFQMAEWGKRNELIATPPVMPAELNAPAQPVPPVMPQPAAAQPAEGAGVQLQVPAPQEQALKEYFGSQSSKK